MPTLPSKQNLRFIYSMATCFDSTLSCWDTTCMPRGLCTKLHSGPKVKTLAENSLGNEQELNKHSSCQLFLFIVLVKHLALVARFLLESKMPCGQNRHLRFLSPPKTCFGKSLLPVPQCLIHQHHSPSLERCVQLSPAKPLTLYHQQHYLTETLRN